MKIFRYIIKRGTGYGLMLVMLASSLTLVACETKVSEQRNAQHGEDTETPGQANRPMEMNEEHFSDSNNYNPDERQSRKRDPERNTMIDGDQANDNVVTEE